MLLFILLASFISDCYSNGPVSMIIKQTWSGNFEGEFRIHIKNNVLGWELKVVFNQPVTDVKVSGGVLSSHDSTGKIQIVVNQDFDGIHKAGEELRIILSGKFTGNTPSAVGMFIDLSHDHQTLPTLPTNIPGQKTKYNYCDVLMKSILFYEAQRSGKLPATNRIPWRGDSALDDKGLDGEDLVGGWYDAGDHVKFGLPMASSTTILAWGLLQWKDAYEKCGQLKVMYDSIKWPLDYFIKAHVKPNEFYVQVGRGGYDHGFWGRPEDMTMQRPPFKITEAKPGSDIAGQTAAALAAGSMVFKDIDSKYSATLLDHAKQLYNFADKFRARYSDSVTEASGYYRSTAYSDELGWAAIWLYMATNNQSYLNAAEKNHLPGAAWGFSWDDTQAGNNVLLYNLTGKDVYKKDIIDTMIYWMPGGTIPYTPKGLAYRLKWGSLRYASNTALIALMAADFGINSELYRRWAMNQLHYALGDAGRSYIVGFGHNPPQRPHHRSSSCPSIPAPCGWHYQTQPGPNPHVLYGALVGGPGSGDGYNDVRKDYIQNEVACDYNAGFQSSIAGLMDLALENKLPTKI